MSNTGWSEPEIERRAVGLAQALRGVAAASRNEEELRIGAVHVLRDFAHDAGIELEARHEYALGRGRADSVYGRVIIEFEAPRSFAAHNTSHANQASIQQVQAYAETLANQDRVDLARILGVATDGQRIIFVRHRRGAWEVQPPRDVDASSVAHLLFCLKSLQGKALLPDNLVEDFGADPDKAAGQCVRALYGTLEATANPKVEALFGQWRLLFSEVCGYDLHSQKLDVAALAQSYGVFAKQPEVARLFFCVHSYYATLIKLLAAEIVTFYSASYLPSYLGGLEALPSNRMREELATLEEGGIFRQLGVRNFLEGDFFAWYLEVWNEELDSALRGIVRALRVYDPATVRVDPDETRDLLKKLYEYLLPKKLRHDLGEYYTPDWLAELVLEEVGYDGDLSKRILDPACGSGTFPVLEIKRAREWAQDHLIEDGTTLNRILTNIVGFDLNPLAVITARTNYLIALGDLLRHRQGEIEIPIYLCDAVLTPTEPRQSAIGGRRFPLETAVGTFEIPLVLGTQERVAGLAMLLEQAVRGRYRTEEFLARARSDLGLEAGEFAEAEEALGTLYGKLCQVDAEGRNGIWARIIKNFFAPVFAGQFDYVAGNPPWINWESLPDGYRRNTAALWAKYGMAPKARGRQFELGTIKRDLSALFLYVAADKYLAESGRLGFLVTESLFKSSGAGAGFRGFELPAKPGDDRSGLRVLRVQDLVDVRPFEGAANRTAVIALAKGQPTQYPVPYVVWKRRPRTQVQEDLSLAEARAATTAKAHVALPITSDRGAPWITGAATALEAVSKAVGRSAYKAWAGTCTWLNSVYWVRVLERLPDGTMLIENVSDVGKIQVRRLKARVEPDLLYPLLRGRDVRPWRWATELHIILPHTLETGWEALAERDMQVHYPLTFAYLQEFREALLGRSGYRQLRQGHPFYILGLVGPHTFAEFKVAWRQMIPNLTPAVLSSKAGKPVVPQHVVTFVPFSDGQEAHYCCAAAGSSPARFIAASYSTGKSFGAPHVLHHISIPRFSVGSALHQRLADLSEQAHDAASRQDSSHVAEIEAEVDEAAAELWGITPQELKTIQKALRKKD